MKNITVIYITFLLLLPLGALSQIKPALTARVDTTEKNVKAVYNLIRNYFNARPDSIYRNPYWNEEEVNNYYGKHKEHFDQAAHYLFFNMSAHQLFNYFPPTVLSVEPVEDKYVIRVLLAADTVQQWMLENKMNPLFLLRYYATKDSEGEWKLENTWASELKHWKQYNTKWITYHFPPSFSFNATKAEKANKFIDSITTTLKLAPPKPFDFYVMSSEEELARLHNLDYWLAYQTGFARKQYNRIFSAHGAEDHLHEFVHMVYHPVKNHFLSEGIATYLGGVDGQTPYQETLKEVSRDLHENHPDVTFKDLYANNFRYATNQNPRYVAGAAVYQLVYDRKGLKGIQKLEEADNSYDSLISTFAELMSMRAIKAEVYLTKYIQEYHQRE